MVLYSVTFTGRKSRLNYLFFSFWIAPLVLNCSRSWRFSKNDLLLLMQLYTDLNLTNLSNYFIYRLEQMLKQKENPYLKTFKTERESEINKIYLYVIPNP